MPRVALIAEVVFAALAFGWRSLLHYRQTGSSGLRGLSGRPGSPEWLGGVLFVVALAVAVAAPLCDLFGALPRIGALDRVAFAAAGVLLFGIGLAGTLWAQLAMGRSWRVGVDPTERTRLVTRGPFRLVRNPIFSAMAAALAGLALLVPNAASLLALALLAIALELHVRLVEEPVLARLHGAEYRRYAASTGRFLPAIGRLPGSLE